jgi:hypothetical protein
MGYIFNKIILEHLPTIAFFSVTGIAFYFLLEGGKVGIIIHVTCSTHMLGYTYRCGCFACGHHFSHVSLEVKG